MHTITGVATSVALFIGWSPLGPTDRAVRLTSFAGYARDYGGLDRQSLLGYCVAQFFDNGGSVAYVMRIADGDGANLAHDEAAFATALNALFDAGGAVDQIDLFNVICVPGLLDAGTIRIMQRRARERRAFLIVDCAQSDTVTTVENAFTEKTREDAANSAVYFPWVDAPDPLQQNALRAFPPSGFVAGVLARTDAARGVWKAPAGVEAGLIGATGLAVAVNDAESGLLNSRGINGLRSFAGRGIVVWGARTLDGDDVGGSDWKYIPVRRTALFLEESIVRGTKWAMFEPNDIRLWVEIIRSVDAFMQGLFRQGAFQGATPNQAYFVKCDGTTTTLDDVNHGVVNIEIGFAALKPAEFVVLRIAQIAGRSS